MVALKADDPHIEPTIPGRKQERRGGIETPSIRARMSLSNAKQERRDGIETGPGGRRRNPQLLKQERRGGIEIAQRARIH